MRPVWHGSTQHVHQRANKGATPRFAQRILNKAAQSGATTSGQGVVARREIGALAESCLRGGVKWADAAARRVETDGPGVGESEERGRMKDEDGEWIL